IRRGAWGGKEESPGGAGMFKKKKKTANGGAADMRQAGRSTSEERRGASRGSEDPVPGMSESDERKSRATGQTSTSDGRVERSARTSELTDSPRDYTGSTSPVVAMRATCVAASRSVLLTMLWGNRTYESPTAILRITVFFFFKQKTAYEIGQ